MIQRKIVTLNDSNKHIYYTFNIHLFHLHVQLMKT